MLNRLLRVIRVEKPEIGLVRSLFSLNFLVVFSFVVGKAARDGLFLSEFSARALPYVYLGLALWTALAIAVYGRLTKRLPAHTALSGGLIGTALSLVLFTFWFRVQPHTPAAVFYLWTGAYGLLLISQFWILANERINPRQARRLFGLIGGGGILGGIAGGAAASQAGKVVSPEWLLLIAAAGFAGGGFLARGSGLRSEESVPAQAAVADREQPGLRELWRRPYVRRLTAIFLVGGIMAAVVDYQFKLLLQGSIADGPMMTTAMTDEGTERITTLLGYFYGAQNLIALVIQVGLTGMILSRLGVRPASMLHPGGLFAGAFVVLLSPGLVPVAALWLYDTVMNISIVRSVREFLYFPLPGGVRRQAKRVMETVINRGAEGAAGLLILAINMTLGGRAIHLAAMLLLLSLLAIVLERFMNRAYLSELSHSLRWMLHKDERPQVSYGEVDLVQELHALLSSEYERRALYAVETLSTIDPEGLADKLPDLLRHPSARVRARALELSADQCITTEMGHVLPLLDDNDDDVRLHAAFFYCQLAPGDPVAEMGELLRSDNARVRSGAFQCVAAHSPADADDSVVMLARQFLERGEKSDRLAVAKGAGRRPPPSAVHTILLDLIDDPDSEIRRETIRSIGATMERTFVPRLIELLDSDLDDEAAGALTRYGDRVVGTLGDHLTDPTVPIGARRILPRVLSGIATQDAANALLRAPLGEDGTFADETLRALNRIRSKDAAVVIPLNTVSEQIRSESERFMRWVDIARALRKSGVPSSSRRLLARALEEKGAHAFRRIFRMLSLLYPPRETWLSYLGVTSENKRLKAQSIEYLETALAPEHSRLIVPLVEISQRRKGGADRGRTEATLRELAGTSDPWVQVCVLFLIGEERQTEMADVASRGARARDLVVRETGGWALRRLGVA